MRITNIYKSWHSLYPYDVPLNLSNKEDRKLYQDAYRGLKEDDPFDGRKEKYSKFVKLMEKTMPFTRIMEALDVATKWDKSGSSTEGKRIPTEAGMVNLFDSNKATKEQVKYHCALVWSDSSFGISTSDYFARFGMAPTNTDELNTKWNDRRLKHVILGQKIWTSLTSTFQIDVQGSRQDFQVGEEY